MSKFTSPLQWIWIIACAVFAVVQSLPPFNPHGSVGPSLIGSAIGGGLFGAITAYFNRRRKKDDQSAD